jgi:hypothetical protein
MIIASFFYILVQAVQVQYYPETQFIPLPSSNLPFFYTNSNTLVLLSSANDEDRLNCANIFNFTAFEWQMIRLSSYSSPPLLVKSASLYINDSFYIIGGLASTGPSNEVWRFSLTQYTWERIAYKGDFPRLYAAGFTVFQQSPKSFLYIYGGYTGVASNSKLFM